MASRESNSCCDQLVTGHIKGAEDGVWATGGTSGGNGMKVVKCPEEQYQLIISTLEPNHTVYVGHSDPNLHHVVWFAMLLAPHSKSPARPVPYQIETSHSSISPGWIMVFCDLPSSVFSFFLFF